jgi:hypothetical protein
MEWSRSAFLQKMMRRMGHEEGKGLGKHGQGISTAIEPVNRGDRKIGLGFIDQRAPHQHPLHQSGSSFAAGVAAATGHVPGSVDFNRALQSRLKNMRAKRSRQARRIG